jgi:transposase
MGRLDGIDTADLQELKDRTDEAKPRERVLAAIGRKQGDSIDRLAERHGVVEKTIRNWLDRFADRPLEEAPYDAPRPGVPGKLDDEQRGRLLSEFATSPAELGYGGETWTSSLAVRHVRSEYGVEYSKRHARHLLAQADTADRAGRSHRRELASGAGAGCDSTVGPDAEH